MKTTYGVWHLNRRGDLRLLSEHNSLRDAYKDRDGLAGGHEEPWRWSVMTIVRYTHTWATPGLVVDRPAR